MNGVSETTVWADHKTPFLKESTRLDYLHQFIPNWRKRLQYRSYAALLALLGVYCLMRFPILAVPVFGAAAYFWSMKGYHEQIYTQDRHLMAADL